MTKPKSTIRDVAIKAGVAVSSVSRVLNNHPSASESMIRRVQGAVTELDFRPNPAAKSNAFTYLIHLSIQSIVMEYSQFFQLV